MLHQIKPGNNVFKLGNYLFNNGKTAITKCKLQKSGMK